MKEAEEGSLVAGYTDGELIEGFRNRDPKVIHILYDLYFVELCDWCYYFIGNSFDAQDIVSDIFERFLSRDGNQKMIGSSFKSLNDIANYLQVAAKSKCFSFLERDKMKRKIHQKVSSQDTGDYSINEQLDFEYTRGLADMKLLETIYNLPYRSIQVLRKIYLEDQSYEQIAIEMGISKTSIGTMRKQGINILAKILNREDFISYLTTFVIICLSII